MSRRTIRAALATYLTGSVTGINTVYRGLPALIPGDAFFPAPGAGNQTGCVLCVNILSDTEARKALGGATSGKKRVDYVVDLQLFFRSVQPAAINSDPALEATDAFDDIIENLKAKIRADRTANSANVWQWGEADLTGVYGEPLSGDNGTEWWAAIRTEVTEWLTT